MTNTPSAPSARRLFLGVSAVAALAVASLMTASPALASAPPSCWTDVDSGIVQCFPTTDDPIGSIKDRSGDPVVAQPTDSMGASAERRNSTLAPNTIYALATVYDSTGFSGASMTYTTSNGAICGNSYSFSSLGSWNDRIQSFQGFNGCDVALYRDVNFGTLIFGPASSSTDVGSAKSQASSLQIG